MSTMPCPHNSHLLVVDDDADIRETLQLVLEEEGYRVATAADGQQAIDLLSGSEAPCLIVLDLMMPVMDGWELFARMREIPRLACIPVCIVSAMADMAPTDSTCVLTKPVNLEALLATVRVHCPRAD